MTFTDIMMVVGTASCAASLSIVVWVVFGSVFVAFRGWLWSHDDEDRREHVRECELEQRMAASVAWCESWRLQLDEIHELPEVRR